MVQQTTLKPQAGFSPFSGKATAKGAYQPRVPSYQPQVVSNGFGKGAMAYGKGKGKDKGKDKGKKGAPPANSPYWQEKVSEENRVEGDGTAYTGTIHSYNKKAGWGFILPDDLSELPADV